MRSAWFIKLTSDFFYETSVVHCTFNSLCRHWVTSGSLSKLSPWTHRSNFSHKSRRFSAQKCRTDTSLVIMTPEKHRKKFSHIDKCFILVTKTIKWYDNTWATVQETIHYYILLCSKWNNFASNWEVYCSNNHEVLILMSTFTSTTDHELLLGPLFESTLQLIKLQNFVKASNTLNVDWDPMLMQVLIHIEIYL